MRIDRTTSCILLLLAGIATAQDITIESPFLKATISPQGGRVVSIKDLATNSELVATGQGMCVDCEWTTRRPEMQKAEYKVKRIDGDIDATYRATDPKLRDLEYTKTYRLEADSPALVVTLNIRNAGDAGRKISPWVFSQVMAGGKADDGDSFFIPAAHGLGEIKLAEASKEDADNFIERPPAGWIAVVDAKQRQGVICFCENEKLARFYVWCGAKPGTLEWVYNEITLTPGDGWTTTYSIVPFQGIAQVSGASAHVVASLARSEDEARQNITLSLVSPFGIGAAAVTVRIGETELTRTDVVLDRGKTAIIDLPTTKVHAGELAIEVATDRFKEGITIALADDGSPRAARVGRASLTNRGGPEKFHIASTPIETPHIKWAKPLPGGPVRALCLVPIPTQRDVVELAQRLDMEYDIVAFQDPLMDAAAVDEFLELLHGKSYGVLILSKVPVGLLPTEAQDLMMEKIGNGMGVLSVNTMSTVKTGAALNCRGSGAFLESALPLDLLPKDCRPSVAVGQCGKGRCVSLSYAARATCLTPEVQFEQVHYRDWECYLELISRAALWAAGRESGVRVVGASPTAATEERIVDPWRTRRLVRVTRPALVRDSQTWKIAATEEESALDTWTGYGAKVAQENGKLKITEVNLNGDAGFGAGLFPLSLDQTPILEVTVDSAKEWALFIPDEHFEKAIATLQGKTAETGAKRYDLRTCDALRGKDRVALCFQTVGEGSALVLGGIRFLKPDGTPSQEETTVHEAPASANVMLRLASQADRNVVVAAMYHGPDYYEGMEKREQRVALAKDQTTEIMFPLLNLCGGKAHSVDLIVRDAEGRSLSFATASYEVISPVGFAATEVDTVRGRRADEDVIIAKLENKGAEREIEVGIELSDMQGQVIGSSSKKIKVPAGKSEQAIEVPTVDSPMTPARARLSLRGPEGLVLEKDSYVLTSLDAEKRFYRRGAEAALVAKINNQAAEREVEAHVALTDMHGRLIATLDRKIRIPAGDSEHRFALPTANSLTTLNRARLTLGDAKGLLLEEDAYIYLPEPQPPSDDYLASTSQFGDRNAYIRPYFTQIARDAQIEGMVIPRRYTFELLKQDAPLMYWGAAKVRAFGYNFHNTETSTARKPCLSDPDTRAKITEAYEDLGAWLKRYGPYAMASLEDESELSGARFSNLEVCTSEHCTSRYHEWLKEKYKTIEALNKEWDTSHKSFEEIKQITYKEARKLDNPAQWVDWRTFMDEVWLDALLLTRKGMKKHYPELRTGFSNSFGQMPFAGWDFETASRHEDMTIEYPTIIDHLTPPKEEDAFEEDAVDMSTVIRQKMDIRKSFLRAECPLPGWIWYDRSEQGAEFKPWWMAFLGAKGCTPWGPTSLGVREGGKHMDFWAFLHPLLAQTNSSKWLASGLHDLTHGVGKIFVDYERVVAPVAVLYSQPSMYIAWAWSDVEKAFYPETTSLYAWYYKSRVNVTRLCRELGFTPRYIGASQIEAGDLKSCKVLFLPCSLCLSDKTIEQIHRFVESGGLVIADLGTGATDENGRPIPSRKNIETLFGITRETMIRTVEPMALQLGGGSFVGEASLKLAGMDVIKPIADAAAKRDAGQPAIIINSVGKGTAVYLNGFLGYNLPSRMFLRNLLGVAGLSTPIRITSGRAEHMGYEIATFRRGDITILGILRLRQEEGPTQIRLSATRHLYDVRAKKYLGVTDTATLDLTQKAAAVLAVMPYEVKGIEVTASPQKVRQGEHVEVKARVLASKGNAGDHVLRMEVYDPSGKPCRAYTDNVSAKGGAFARRIQTALNDPPGRWRIALTDVISGKTGQVAVEIVAR